MKHGKSSASDSEFPYWVLPDKPMEVPANYGLAWDSSKTAEQAEQFRDLLGRSCEGKWMETNHRYFFELEKDYEMFLIMCNLSI
jgi:hypothetical protein